MQIFGERIRKLREEKGISQSDLAAQFQISQNAIASYERGAREPNMERLKELAIFFNVSLDYLLGRTNDRSRVFRPTTREILDMLHLSDDEIYESGTFTIDGQPVSKEDFKSFILQVRLKRQLDLEQFQVENSNKKEE